MFSLHSHSLLIEQAQLSAGDRPGLTSNHSVTIMVNALPDPPSWSVPPFPFMAVEDEAMLVSGVSLTDPDGVDTHLRVSVWAEKGILGLPGGVNASSSLEVEEGVGDDGERDGSFTVLGNETVLNVALAGLVYYPPADWTSFRQVNYEQQAVFRAASVVKAIASLFS